MKAFLLFGVVVLAAAAAEVVKVHVKNVVEHPGPIVENPKASYMKEKSLRESSGDTDKPTVIKPKVKVIQHTAGSNTFGDKVDGYNTEDDVVEPYERTPEEESVSALADQKEVGQDQDQLDAKEKEEKKEEADEKKFEQEMKAKREQKKNK